jgi:Ubinuclein conserved middle domain
MLTKTTIYFFIRHFCSTLEGSASQVSEQGLRKALYQKIVAAFPEGWMSSGQVSREGERNATQKKVGLD